MNVLSRSGPAAGMGDDYNERQWFFDRRTDKTIFSKRFDRGTRIASHIIDGQPGLSFAKVKDEVVLRQTPAGRYEIKATFLEDDRAILTLTIQKYSSRSGPHEKQHFLSWAMRSMRSSISLPA
jgi:hypothetical protein